MTHLGGYLHDYNLGRRVAETGLAGGCHSLARGFREQISDTEASLGMLGCSRKGVAAGKVGLGVGLPVVLPTHGIEAILACGVRWAEWSFGSLSFER